MEEEIVRTLTNDGIVVVRTDTLYGIIALAARKEAVEKVYTAKSRAAHKQCILLISKPSDAPAHQQLIAAHSTDAHPTSVIVPATTEPEWILRGGNSIAYRVVRDPLLRAVISQAGPVIAPSANPEGLPPACTVTQAQDYFGAAIDLYVDGGEVSEDVAASRLIQVNPDGSTTQLR